MERFAVISLGCAKNLVDTEIMLGQLFKAGWELTEDFSAAELILINTCGFIDTAKSESIHQILEVAEYKKPTRGVCKKLVVAGCLVQRYAAELALKIPEVDRWIRLGEIGEIIQLIHENHPKQAVLKDPFLNNQNLPRFQVTLKHTAYVKIAEGCDHWCSYCAIPLIKGRFTSRKLDSIIAEVRELVRAGVREVNLIAQDVTKYGHDLTPPVNLRILLEEIISRANPEWIRLLYAYPSGVEADLLNLVASQSSICKYLDLPLQHINARILRLMNRSESPEVLKEKLVSIREIVPEIALRTTFLLGFPGETEAEFSELLDFVAEGHFNHVGVFTFSREEGTKAYHLKPQIKEEVKQSRKQRVLAEQQKVSATFLAKQMNREQIILIDKILPNGSAVGRSQSLAPEVDGVIYVDMPKSSPGRFIKGIIIGNDTYNLYAKEIFSIETGIS